jgi:nucleotide-binding universal stress UspA family protein
MKAVQSRARLSLKNILFCTDLSSDADIALPYAAELARHFGARLLALHVRFGDRYAFIPEVGPLPTALSDDRIYDNLSAMMNRFPGVEHEVLVEEGEVWPALASVIREKEIDLVVIGTRGRTGIKKFLLGSEAEEILRQAPCPVMTVGPELAKHLPRGGGVSNILYATDLSPESTVAAPYAISLAQEYQAHLTLLHIIAPQRTGDLVTTHELVASSDRLMRNMMPAEAELWCEPQYLVEEGEPAAKILETAERMRADLIVLGVRRTSNLGAATHLPGATAHKVVTQAICPVLTVRE